MKSSIFWTIFFLAINNLCCAQTSRPSVSAKIKGMHIFARHDQIDHGLEQLGKANVEHVAFVPYAWQETPHTTEIRHSKKDSLGQWTRRDSAFILQSLEADSFGIKSIMKPHIWMRNAGSDEWRNAIQFDTEAEWETWQSNYRNMILHYAEMAESLKMPLMCLGVELRSTVQQREAFWRSLIADVRQVYSGKLTYGGNWWEEYKEVPFWDALDYIGIQAYFPLTDGQNSSLEKIKAGWQKHKASIEKLAKRYNKPVLFTEVGYLNTTDNTNKPWVWPEAVNAEAVEISDLAQAQAYEAFFQTFWKEDWFAGVIFWQWRINRQDYTPRRRQSRFSFSPQNRPAENVIRDWFVLE